MGDAAAKEPTMEDILSSIRKIIAEEGDLPDDVASPQSGQNTVPEVRPETEDYIQEAPAPAEVEEVSAPVEVEEVSAPVEVEEVSAPVEVEEAPAAVEAVEAPAPVEAEEAQAQAEVGEEPIVEPVAVAGSLAQIAAGLQSEEAQFEEPFRPLDAQASEAEDAAADDPSLASRSLADIAAAVKAMENNGEEHKAEDAPAEVVSEQPVEQITELPDEQAVAQQAPAPALVAAAPEPAPVEQQLSEQEATYVEMAQAMEGPNPVATDSDHQGNHDSDIEEAAFKGALMSPGADVAVSGSFERLKRSMMDDLDAKTESIMRPLLRDWLDENLPNMVERLVREEIERVSRG